MVLSPCCFISASGSLPLFLFLQSICSWCPCDVCLIVCCWLLINEVWETGQLYAPPWRPSWINKRLFTWPNQLQDDACRDHWPIYRHIRSVGTCHQLAWYFIFLHTHVEGSKQSTMTGLWSRWYQLKSATQKPLKKLMCSSFLVLKALPESTLSALRPNTYPFSPQWIADPLAIGTSPASNDTERPRRFILLSFWAEWPTLTLVMALKSRNDSGFSSMPAELTSGIFCQLPLLSDVFALAQTSQKLRRVWTENATSIYSHVAPRSLSCMKYARVFLEDQGGPKFGEPLCPHDIFTMVRNSRKVENAILQFEKDIVPKVGCIGRFCGYSEIDVPSLTSWQLQVMLQTPMVQVHPGIHHIWLQLNGYDSYEGTTKSGGW